MIYDRLLDSQMSSVTLNDAPLILTLFMVQFSMPR